MRTQLYSHNKAAYQKVMKAFETADRTCVVHPTGTGKSFLIAAVSESFERVLILGPNDFVLNQVRSVMTWHKGAEFMTYTWLNFHGADKEYDLICLDEFHRAGATEWGDAVNDLLTEQTGAKVFGTTATPIRHLDGERDMAEELFGGNVASEITLGEAMSRYSILPIPTYVTGLFDFSSTLRQTAEKISTSKYLSQEEKQRRLESLNVTDEEWERSSGMPVIIRKHISDECRRIIVFCSDVPTLDQMAETVREWFRKADKKVADIYIIHNELSDKRQKQVMEDFEADGGDGCKIMMSVNMLNEGVHIPRVGAVIMLRTTTSRIIYMQQMGRCLTASNSERPVILDMVDNITNTCAIHDLKRDFDAWEQHRKDYEDREYTPRELHITDYTRTVRDIIKALQHGTTNNRLTLEEIKRKIRDFTAERDRWPLHKRDNASKYEKGLAKRFSIHKDELLQDEAFRHLYEYYRDKDKPVFDECLAVAEAFCEKYGKTPNIYSKKGFTAETEEEEKRAFFCWRWLRTNYPDDERVARLHQEYNNRWLRESEIVRRVELCTAFIKENQRQPSTYYGGEEITLQSYMNSLRQQPYCEREDVQELFRLADSVKRIVEDADELLEEYIRFCETNKKIPSKHSKDEYEVNLYKRVEPRKSIKANPRYIEVKDKYKKVRMSQEDERRIVTEHCEQTGRRPSKQTSSAEVFRAWHNIKRTDADFAKMIQDKYPAVIVWSDEDTERYADQMIAFAKEHNRRPNVRLDDKRLCNILSTLLKSKGDHPAVIRLKKVLSQLPPPVYSPKYYNTRQRGLRSHSERYGYVVVKDRGENPDTRYVIFYTNDTKRNEQYERKCQDAGMKILKFSNS